MNPTKTLSNSPWPESMVLLLGRFSLASVFWLSGQTKIEGFAFNLIQGHVHWGCPVLKDSTLFLFQHEYNLPLIPYIWAAYLATTAEHLLPILLLFGIATRFAALGIFAMTMVIEIFVYPEAYATHATWLTISALLLLRGAGIFSVDHLFISRRRSST